MDVKYLNECMAYTLRKRNIECETFEEANLRVFKRYDYNAQSVFSAIGKGGFVLPIISEDYLGADGTELCFCAILAINNVKREITLYNPINDEEVVDPIDAFLEAWTESGADCITAFKSDANTFVPEMIDLSSIEIPQELSELTEMLAEHSHNVWAMERQSEGWTYGRERNDRKLETPDMVAYSQLPETEKQYDRLMAGNIIKLLIASGYKISAK